MLVESLRFFSVVPAREFFFGFEWSPQVAIRDGQVASTGVFGALPIFAGTFLISTVALAVALPFGLFSAIYLASFATSGVRNKIKPAMEILAGFRRWYTGFSR